MFIRPITLDDVENFYHMMCWLDEETEYMMYEPGERQLKSNNLDDLKGSILILLFFLFRLIEFHDFIYIYCNYLCCTLLKINSLQYLKGMLL